MQDPNDNQTDNQDNDSDTGNDAGSSKQPIAKVPEVDETLPDEAQFEEPVASPSVMGEESASGDAPDGEPVDIDEQLKSIGRDEDQI